MSEERALTPAADNCIRREPDGQAQPSAGDAFLAVIERVASNPQVNIETMRAMLDMKITVMKMESEAEFNRSMQAAQSEMKQILRDAKAEGKPYARLETIDRETREIVTRHGFSLTFGSKTPQKPGAVCVTCHVMHRAGHSRDYELEGDLDTTGIKGSQNKTNIQGLGSAVSYLRRYLKLMIFDLILTNEDNDGNRRITQEQADQIRDMIAECQMSPVATKAFWDLVGVERIEDLAPARFPAIMESLRKKLQQVRGRA